MFNRHYMYIYIYIYIYIYYGTGGPFDTREAAAAASIENAEAACPEDRLEDVYAFPENGCLPCLEVSLSLP